MRRIVIGDIHGCNRALRNLLDRVRPGEEDQLILLGDLFDRGMESWEVYQTVRQLAADFGERFTLLRGNHEDYLLQPELSFLQRMAWDRVGRGAARKSFRQHGSRMEDAAPWIAEHCRLFWRGEGIQCVHAGILVDPIEANDLHTLVHDHEAVLRNRYAGPLTVVGHIALEEAAWFAGDGKTVRKLSAGQWRTLPEKGVICIDTGCGKGGKLTALVAEESRYLLESVPE